MTRANFTRALGRHGIQPRLCGYFVVTFHKDGSDGVLIYARNGGAKYRSQLAYLIAEQSKAVKQ